MKRWSDSKTFISLINVILILLAVMVITGCATSTVLTTAAYEGQTPVIKDLLNKGADVNERGACGFGWPSVTPLSCAVYGGHMEAVKELIDRGADVNANGWEGWTPLMLALEEGHAGIAKILIEKGADVEGAMARCKRQKRQDAYELLERLAKKQQPPRDRASPSMLPTALPLPTEPVAPF